MVASTLSEVARLAGVSPATASRVLNGSARKPGPDIAERVRSAAESLGYVPNAQAQALAKSSSGLIGLIVHDIADPYFAAIARGVQEAAREQGRMVLLATTAGAPADEREAVAAFAARRADSIVIAGSRSARPEDRQGNAGLAAELDRYCRNGGQVAVVGHGVVGAASTEGYHVVTVPNEELAAKLAAELAASHHGHFVIIGGPAGLFTSDDRIRGFQRGLADTALPPAEIIRTEFTRSGGFDVGIALAARIKASQAAANTSGDTKRICIFAVNDVMAIGAAAALRAEGLRIPRDAIIAGFDDIESLRDFRPPLSTVHLPLEEIGRQATRRAGETAGENAVPPAITGHVTLRRSTEGAFPAP
ncbi:LacI family DNA-binding transcriptional regulator [Pseudarthrobacter sulfonivorans]|uniref:LacI family DNA-binding transcriptional regulator n=1 Tax=Pseudarthrobacter sulfonivorans TaxID=121292 RepID=UPI002104FC61|nr:LacI family DNA-binding transcriptional regulator [Pseudarthrobacter sulfonivorans]